MYYTKHLAEKQTFKLCFKFILQEGFFFPGMDLFSFQLNLELLEVVELVIEETFL